MVNFKRRERQANENAKIVTQKFIEHYQNGDILYAGSYSINNERDLDQITAKMERDMFEIVNPLEPDWAIPIIIEAVSRIYYDDLNEYVEFGTVFKRTLAYIWCNNFNDHGDRKNIGQLLKAIELSYVLENTYALKKMYVIKPEFSFDIINGYIIVSKEYAQDLHKMGTLIQGRGKRLRIAEMNSILMNEHVKEFCEGLTAVLNGSNPRSVAIFKDTFYEHIPDIKNMESKKFWQEVFYRYSFYLAAWLQSVDSVGCNALLFHEFEVKMEAKYITQEIAENSFWQKQWFEKIDPERYGSLIVERPILRISRQGDFVTSAVLIGDSINSYVEDQILKYAHRNNIVNLPCEVFQKAISDEFENNTINLFRTLEFEAGHVSENGVWKLKNENVDLKKFTDSKLFGEIDALAYEPNLSFCLIIECKVLNDVRDSKSYKNIVAKLSEDSEGFRLKLQKKREWVKDALSLKYNIQVEPVMIILTDIPLPVLELDKDEIIYTWYDNLKLNMVELLATFS